MNDGKNETKASETETAEANTAAAATDNASGESTEKAAEDAKAVTPEDAHSLLLTLEDIFSDLEIDIEEELAAIREKLDA